ncbi:uncharacterized protein BX664DRAFT_342934 [Halteromyces radiatus]|uniref:uncharacterized protein n=1 Tax=Halteromyces radiatus TaxID=101107 RepID=UPI002220BACD|nr:uncharacterized protein BX664DRAFT_342934 [Halteromyces radiatus]KAI8078876.1 hypothetical protein BX664DRAFT_342934 [Halteromyces radiatus]
MIGPSIPEHLLKKKQQEEVLPEEASQLDNNNNDDDDDADAFMPELPPDLQPPTPKRRTMGPALPPPGASTTAKSTDNDDDDDIIGPALPSQYDVEQASLSSTIAAIEERAKKSEDVMNKASSGETKVERPEWMLAPPDVDYLANANTGRPRSFNQRTVDAGKRDTSSWTDTPADKARKQLQKEDDGEKRTTYQQPSQSEMETRRKIEQHNKTERPLSLLELHRMNKTSSKRKAEDDPTKRPFDREKDLMGTRKMSKKQKAELLEKSSEWSDRFSSNRGSSFL